LSETTATRRHVSGNADTPVHKYWPVLTTFSTLRCGWWTWPTSDLTAMMRSLSCLRSSLVVRVARVRQVLVPFELRAHRRHQVIDDEALLAAADAALEGQFLRVFQNIPFGLERGMFGANHGAEFCGSPTSCKVSQCSIALPSAFIL